MIEFDLEKAKAGAKVCTKNGLSVRIICFDMKDDKYPLVALIDEGDSETVYSFTEDGKQYTSSDFNDFDLMLIGEEKEGFINIYRNIDSCVAYYSPIFYSEKEAENNILINNLSYKYIATKKICWEE